MHDGTFPQIFSNLKNFVTFIYTNMRNKCIKLDKTLCYGEYIYLWYNFFEMIINILKKFRVLFIFGGIISALAGLVLAVYFFVIPPIVASHRLHDFLNKKLYEQAGVNVVVDNVKLDTSHFPFIVFTADNFEIIKDKKAILILRKIDTKISIAQIKFKKIIVNKLGASYIFADVNKIIDIIPKSDKEQKPSDWSVDIMNAFLYVKDANILYSSNGVNFDITGKNIDFDMAQKGNKFAHFDLSAVVTQDKNKVNVLFKDNNKVYIKNNKIFLEENVIDFNKSKMFIKGYAKDDKNFNIGISAKAFDVSTIVSIVRSDTIIPNGSSLLSFFDDIKGNFDFKFNVNQKGILGDVSLHKLAFIFIPVEKVPVHLYDGHIIVGLKNIDLKNFVGYYGTKTVNKINFSGNIKDYMKTFDMKIKADAVVTNDFAKYYLSPVIGIPLELTGKGNAILFARYLKGVTDLKWGFKIEPDCNLLVGGEPISKYKEKRVLVSNMQIKDTFLRIKSMDYYVTVPGVKEFTKRKLISLVGLINFAKGVDFRMMGFDIATPVPSEFLNIIARTELFKKGTVVGHLKAVDGPKGVKLFGNIKLDKVIVPSQRLYLKSANLNTDFDDIKLDAVGGYRRSRYTASGVIANNIAFPVVVKDINLKIDSMDFEKILQSFNQQEEVETQKATGIEDESSAPTFDLSNIIIKKCVFRLIEGVYKDLSVKNLEANVTMEDGDLELNSNKFDFANGTSSCHICCHTKEHHYHARLGVRDVDSNQIATSLLNLPKEISGKADGLLDLHTDKNMKLNGNIKFRIKDGTIEKIGLIEYILKVAAVFRNPIAMISPMTIFDLMNVPDGKFNKIEGTLGINNNIVDTIKIKSYAQSLAAYITGTYNLEKQDASLRIYTRLSNKKSGLYGFLRKISLGNIARVSLGARYDINYYSSDVSEIPNIDGSKDDDSQIFMTTVDGDVATGNFISSLKKLK